MVAFGKYLAMASPSFSLWRTNVKKLSPIKFLQARENRIRSWNSCSSCQSARHHLVTIFLVTGISYTS